MKPTEIQKRISIEDLMKHLRLSRNYITRNITRVVKHLEQSPSRGSKVYFDANELRMYLTEKAVFTRQTKRINVYEEVDKYVKESQTDRKFKLAEFIGAVPDLRSIPRSHIPSIEIKSRDFWDFDLIFPKEYTQGDTRQDAPRTTAEIFYRDMLKVGAVKIRLGNQKTMFYIEGNVPLKELLDTPVNDLNCYLVPADWKPFYKGIPKPQPPQSKAANLTISVIGDAETFDPNAIEYALRKGFVVNQTIDTQMYDKESVIIKFSARVLNEREENAKRWK